MKRDTRVVLVKVGVIHQVAVHVPAIEYVPSHSHHN